MGTSAFSCWWPVSRAAFPFGCDGRSLMPRQWREDLALAGVQTMLISTWVSGSSSHFFRSPSKHLSATVPTPRASQFAQQGKGGQNVLSNPAGLQSHSFPNKEMLKIECRVFTVPRFEIKRGKYKNNQERTSFPPSFPRFGPKMPPTLGGAGFRASRP